MAMSDKIAQNAQPHLEAGEQVQGAFAGQKTLTNKAGSGGYRVEVATDRRFLVFSSGTFSQTKIKDLITTAPREQRLGPAGGLFHDVEIGGETMKVNRRYFSEIEAIDAAQD